jgi:hypothetical protein
MVSLVVDFWAFYDCSHFLGLPNWYDWCRGLSDWYARGAGFCWM